MDKHPSAIAYTEFKPTDGPLKFAHFNGLSWEIEIVLSDDSRGIDLAFDPLTGEPTMSDLLGSKLNFARFDGSSWDSQVVVNHVSGKTSLAYDSTGNPSISYRQTGGPGPQRGLRFARFDGSSWTTELVEQGTVASSHSLAYGPAGNPSIAYSDDTVDTIQFACFDGPVAD